MSESEINEKKQKFPEGFKDIRCIVCPTGCLVHVENVNGELIIEGHSCKRGEEYAREEFISPRRIQIQFKDEKNKVLYKKKRRYVIPSEMLEIKLNLSELQIEPKCKNIEIEVIPRPEVLIEED